MVRRSRSTLHDLADEDLIALAQDGRLDAFDVLYERHKRPAYSLAARMVGYGAAAEDVVQEVFLSVWRSIERYDPSKASVRTWLLRIVHRRAVDALRSRTVHLRGLVDGGDEDLTANVASDDPPPDEQAAQREQATAVRCAIDELPEDQRAVVELAYYRGFTHAEIAEMLDTPLGTVKGRMRLALEKMRTTLDEQIAEPAHSTGR